MDEMEDAHELRGEATASFLDPRGSMSMLKGLTIADISEGQHGCALTLER